MAISAVAAAVASGSFPVNRFRSYSESRELKVRGNEYESGWSQRAQVTVAARRTFTLSMRLSASLYATLEGLFAAKGLALPFYFLPIGEVSNVIVRFDKPLNPVLVPGGRVDVSTVLVEIE